MSPTNPPFYASLPTGSDPAASGEAVQLGILASFCWRRKTVLLLCLVLGLLSGILYWQRQDEIFASSAQLLLIAGKDSTESSSATVRRDRLEAQIGQLTNSLIKERIIRQALSRLPNVDLTTGEVSEDLLIAVDDNLLKLSLIANDSVVSQQLLQSIIESYQFYLEFTPQSNRIDARRQLTASIQRLEQELADHRLQYSRLLSSTPFAGTTRGIHEQIDERLAKLEARLHELKIRKAELARQLRSLPKTTESELGSQQQLSLPALSQLEKAAANEMLALQLKERLTASRARGKTPQVRRASKDAQQALQVFAQVGKRAAIQSELEKLKESEEAIEHLLNTEHAKAQKWSDTAVKVDRLVAEIDLKEEMLQNTKKELQKTNLALELESYKLQVIVPAEAGSPSPISQTLGNALVIGMTCGLALGLLLASWNEFRDQSFQTPTDIQHRLGVPLLGQLPFAAANQAASDRSQTGFLLANYQLSHTEFAEQFRKIRTELALRQHKHRGQVLLVASQQHGEGRTLTAANLAAAIAQTGKKTLLVDADLQQPQLHNIFGVPQLGGLAALLVDNIEWQSVVQPSSLANLDLITSGQTYGVPSELLSSLRCTEFIRTARKSYDYVILDAPPLADKLDAIVLAKHVDNILLLLSVGNRTRIEARQAMERLGTLSKRVMGVILNNPNNKKLVWRTDPFEAYRWAHHPHASHATSEKSHASAHVIHHPNQNPLHHFNAPEKKPLVDYDAQELQSLLSELSAEMKQVAAGSRSVSQNFPAHN